MLNSYDGTIYTKEKYAGGIVGRWSGTGTFENCSSDVEISYRPDGGDDATAGGFIGVSEDFNSSITIRNGLSTASISGVDNLSGQGGFIGWTNGRIIMDNCFADVTFQAGNSDPGETFVRNRYPDSDNYYTNACGNSTQGTKVTSAEAVSAELAWKMNTNNGTMDNTLAWAQADGTTHPLLADEEHKAVCRITYEVSGNAVGTAYSKKDGTVDIPAQNPVREGCDFLGWYIGSTPVTETTVLTGDAVATATFKESVAHAKDRLRTLLGDAVTADGQLDEETYTTASYPAYKEAWNAVAAAANAALETQTEAVEDIWQAIEAFETNYAAAKAKLTEADATAHLVYGAGTDAVTSEAVRYASGDAVELTAEAAGNGYVFRGWYRGDRLNGSSVPATKNLSANVTIGTEDVTYQAVYARIPEITAPELVGTYGDKVSELVISGGAATVTAQGAQAEAVAGTWKLDENEETKNQLPQVKDTDSYTLTFVPEDALYYEKVSVEVIPQIAPKKITVTIKDASRNEGEENPTFAYETLEEGVLAGSDKAEDLNMVLSCAAVKASKAGSYPITGSYENDNYNITFVNGTLTVKKVASSVTYGDLVGNDGVNLRDAQQALRFALNIDKELTEEQKLAGDVMDVGDGITLKDAQAILKRALNIPMVFDVEK